MSAPPEPTPSTASGRTFTSAPGELPLAYGPYEVTGVLGRGAMGTVFAAEQREPLVREVAVKVVRTDAMTAGSSTGFSEERLALSRLRHPNIARVYDAGMEDGMPYLVMERVEGRSILQHCDARRLSIEARLRLFLEVCGAIRHAHRKGILHRDIKPSNVLVDESEEPARVQVIDFGVAKLIERGSYAEAVAVGTPGYMSPEASEGSPEVDTRTDVYALGVLLQVLVPGQRPTPYGPAPERSFLRVFDAETAAARRLTPSRLAQRVRGDLLVMVQHATATCPDARYGSVDELAADVRRHLRHEPISRRSGRFYVLGRFVRRHSAGGVLTALTLGAVVVAGAAVVQSSIEARDAEARALSAAREAESESAEARALKDFLLGLVTRVDSRRSVQHGLDVDAMITPGIREALADPGSMSSEEVALMVELERLYGRIGRYDQQVAFAEAVARGPGTELDRGARAARLARARNNAGRYREAQEGLRPLALDPPASFPAALRARLLLELGDAERMAGAHDVALRSFRAAAAALGPSRDPATRLLRARVDQRTAKTYFVAGDPETATHFQRRALRAREELLGPNHILVTDALVALATIVSGNLEESEPLFRRAIERLQRQLGPDHPRVGQMTNNFGFTLLMAGRPADAVPMLERALESARASFDEGHPAQVNARTNLGLALCDLGRAAEAEPLLRKAVALRELNHPPGHVHRATSHWAHGRALRDLGRWNEARVQFEAAIEVLEPQPRAGDFGGLARVLDDYAVLLERTGDAEGLAEVRRRRRELEGGASPTVDAAR